MIRIVGKASGEAGPMAVAGARTLTEDAIEEVLEAADWWAAESREGGFVIELHDVDLGDYQPQIAGALDALRLSTPELAGWTWEVEEVGEPETLAALALVEDVNVTPDDEIMQHAAHVVRDLEASMELVAHALELAPLFRAVPLEDLRAGAMSDDGMDRSEEHETRLLAGLLVMAALITQDELSGDAARLHEDPRDMDSMMVLWMLPKRFSHGFTPVFVQRMIAVFTDLTRRIQLGWEPPSCVAQELCVRIWLDQVEILQDSASIDLPSGWRARLEDLFFEDLDHEYLYDPAFDGIEDGPGFGGMAPMGFDDWFTPFRAEVHVPLYALKLESESSDS